jgi:hypothetical protein
MRVVRPMSRMRPSLPRRMGMMSASQAILRMVEAVTGPVNANVPVPEPVPEPVPVPDAPPGPLLALVGLRRVRRSW